MQQCKASLALLFALSICGGSARRTNVDSKDIQRHSAPLHAELMSEAGDAEPAPPVPVPSHCSAEDVKIEQPAQCMLACTGFAPPRTGPAVDACVAKCYTDAGVSTACATAKIDFYKCMDESCQDNEEITCMCQRCSYARLFPDDDKNPCKVVQPTEKLADPVLEEKGLRDDACVDCLHKTEGGTVERLKGLDGKVVCLHKKLLSVQTAEADIMEAFDCLRGECEATCSSSMEFLNDEAWTWVLSRQNGDDACVDCLTPCFPLNGAHDPVLFVAGPAQNGQGETTHLTQSMEETRGKVQAVATCAVACLKSGQCDRVNL